MYGASHVNLGNRGTKNVLETTTQPSFAPANHYCDTTNARLDDNPESANEARSRSNRAGERTVAAPLK